MQEVTGSNPISPTINRKVSAAHLPGLFIFLPEDSQGNCRLECFFPVDGLKMTLKLIEVILARLSISEPGKRKPGYNQENLFWHLLLIAPFPQQYQGIHWSNREDRETGFPQFIHNNR